MLSCDVPRRRGVFCCRMVLHCDAGVAGVYVVVLIWPAGGSHPAHSEVRGRGAAREGAQAS